MARKAGPKESEQYGYPCSSSEGPAGEEAAAARCHTLEAANRSAAKPFLSPLCGFLWPDHFTPPSKVPIKYFDRNPKGRGSRPSNAF